MPRTGTTAPGTGGAGRVGGAVRWLLAPATDQAPRGQALAATGLRILLGLLWLYNVSWKRAPEFGQDEGNGLYKFTKYAVEYPVFPPYSWVVEHLVLPVFTPFGWMVLLAETTLAVLLLTGAWIRLAAALGLAQSLAIALSVAFAPEEWPWAYWLMLGAHALILFSSAGRFLAVDGVRARVSTVRPLVRVFAALAFVAGLFSIGASIGDPLDSRGPGLHSTDLSISLGYYNLVGGLVLVVIAALLLAADATRSAALATTALVLGVVGALSLHAQLGFTSPILGGNPTSAAFLLCLAVVAGALTLRLRDRTSATTSSPAGTASDAS